MEIEVHEAVYRHRSDRRQERGSDIKISAPPFRSDDFRYHEQEEGSQKHGADDPGFQDELEIIVMGMIEKRIETFRMIGLKDILESPETASEKGEVPESRQSPPPRSEPLFI